MIISVGSKLPVTLLEENQTTPVTPTSADGNFNSSTDVVLDLGVGADVPLLTDDLLQSPSPIRITRSFSDSSLAHHPPPSASFISSIASKARSVASSALARSLKKDRQKQQSLPRRPLNILCSMSISHLCRISLFFAGLYLVFLYIYTVQNLRQPSEELLGVGLLGEGGLSYINNSDHLIVDVASDTPKSSSNNNNSSIDSVIHQNHNHKHLGSDTIDAIQHALSPYPSFPDITAEAFNLLPTKCKIFIQGQVPGNDQRISPDGNDGDDFGEVTKWKRENPGKVIWPTFFSILPLLTSLSLSLPPFLFFSLSL